MERSTIRLKRSADKKQYFGETIIMSEDRRENQNLEVEEVSEEQLKAWHELPKEYKKYRNNRWAFQFGIKLYQLLRIDKRIRK